MRIKSIFQTAFFISLVFCAPIAYAQNAPSAKDFATRPFRGFSISPNGKNLVFLSGEDKDAKIVLINTDTGQNTIVPTAEKEITIRSVGWANDEYLLVDFSYPYRQGNAPKHLQDVYTIKRSIAFPIGPGNPKLLVPDERLQVNTVLPIEFLNYSDSTIIMSGDVFVPRVSELQVIKDDERNYWRNALYLTDLKTGRGREIDSGGGRTIGWVFDKKGNAKIRMDLDLKLKIATLYLKNARSWRKFLEFKDAMKFPFTIEGLLDDNTALITVLENGINAAKTLNLENGEIRAAFADESRSIADVRHDPFTKEPVALTFDTLLPQTRWIDPVLGRHQELLNRSFPKHFVYIQEWTRDKSQLIIGVESGQSRFKNYLFNVKNNSAELLTEYPASFENYNFPRKELLSFKASDGLEIPVFVTKPNTKNQGKPLPAIILPHGGPESQDEAGFDYIAQFLATRGYLIIQPQFRGSTGNGAEFAKSGYGEWGAKMQSDISDSLGWAVNQGLADKNKVCIVGASFGGYAALIGATLTSDLYACAISFAGVSDLGAMQKYEEELFGKYGVATKYWNEHIGISRYETEKIRAISPLFNVNRAKSPILLIHGVDDTIVPIQQSREMASALRRAGKTVQLIELQGDDHHLSRHETRERYLVELEKFLAPILKPEQ